jgi:rare lipoprotein A
MRSVSSEMLPRGFLSPSWAAGESVKTENGMAAVYAQTLVSRRTTNGEKLDGEHLTAPHRSLPFGTIIEVTNREKGRTAKVRISDRAPHRHGIFLDLSPAAAAALGIGRRATATVEFLTVEATQAARFTSINRRACMTCMYFHSC